MEFVGILLGSIVFGALNFTFFMAGYYFGSKKENIDGVTVNENNKDLIEEMMKWRNFSGK